MGTKHLFSNEAKEKMKELVESIDFNMMATALSKLPIHAIPMSTKKVDDEGKIWFLSGKDSQHNANIEKDSSVHLFYAKPMGMEFLNIFGKATISQDRKIIHDLYQKSDDTWFDGKDDPNITAIMVKPQDVYYWDTKDNMLVSLLKMGVGAITGEKQDLGEEGELRV